MLRDTHSELLGGAERVRTRVRRFAPWTPQAYTLELLERVQGVLDEYVDYLPLTIPQIFYRLVGRYEYEKTERAYVRLCEHLNRARRARIIPMTTIRDDGTTPLPPSAEQFLDVMRYRAERLMLDHTVGQKTRLVVTCEAAGMAPQLGRVANPHGSASHKQRRHPTRGHRAAHRSRHLPTSASARKTGAPEADQPTEGHPTMKIDAELAVESLWQAFEWEPIKLTQIFDRIASRLHRHPVFRNMSITEVDRLLADARREAEQDLSDYEWRLAAAFRDAIASEETDANGVAA
jgi:hypothetical protein